MKHTFSILALLLITLTLGCGDTEKEPPLLTFEPTTVMLQHVDKDQTSEASFDIINTAPEGAEDLVITSSKMLGLISDGVTYCGESRCNVFEVVGFKPGLTIEPGKRVTLKIRYHGQKRRLLCDLPQQCQQRRL